MNQKPLFTKDFVIGLFAIQMCIVAILFVIWVFLELLNSVGLPDYFVIIVGLIFGMFIVRNIVRRF